MLSQNHPPTGCCSQQNSPHTIFGIRSLDSVLPSLLLHHRCCQQNRRTFPFLLLPLPPWPPPPPPPPLPLSPHPTLPLYSSYTNPTRQMDCDVCKSWHCEIVRAHRRLLYMLITDTESTSYGKRKTELGYHTPYCNFGKKFELHKLIKYTFQTDSKMQLV